MPKATITKAAIGRVLDACIARQEQFGSIEIRPDGIIIIHPLGDFTPKETVDTAPSQPAPKEWRER